MHINSLSPEANHLSISWNDNKRTTIPYLWLRDNCNCEQCKVVQTGEKSFNVCDVDVDIRPASVNLIDDSIVIKWQDNHQTQYPSNFLAITLNYHQQETEHWGNQFQPQRFDFNNFINNDTTAANFITEYLKAGACVIENAPQVLYSIEQLTVRLGPIREVVFDRIHNVIVDDKGYNVALTNLSLPPHNDLASQDWPPSAQALYMVNNECEGGETIIVDSFRIAEQIRLQQPHFFNSLCTVKVPFRIYSEAQETYSINPMITLNSQGQISLVRYSNQTMQAIPLNQPDLDLFYRAYHYLSSAINNASEQAMFRLNSGDVLVTAGHRVLHGRKAFKVTGIRHLQDAYFEHDNIRNHLYTLKRNRRL